MYHWKTAAYLSDQIIILHIKVFPKLLCRLYDWTTTEQKDNIIYELIYFGSPPHNSLKFFFVRNLYQFYESKIFAMNDCKTEACQ